jgi:hypothetical protein
MDDIEDLEQGIEALLIGALLLADAILEKKSARITAPMVQEMRLLLEMTHARALDERSAAVRDLGKAGDYLEKTIRLIDGGFNSRVVRLEVKQMIETLEDLLCQPESPHQ